ncbi:MAG: hypothetical protein WD071_03870 [Pseudohongiella sp.]|uniref:hypothetical protein n=1 Tax=Pseudohongiella sp. TaxID=1979412 RepID=UPI00349FD7CD
MTYDKLSKGIRKYFNRFRAVAMVRGNPVYKTSPNLDKAVKWREKRLAINKRKPPPGGVRSKKRSNAKDQGLPAGFYHLEFFNTRVDGTKVARHKIGTTIFKDGVVPKRNRSFYGVVARRKMTGFGLVKLFVFLLEPAH